MTAAPPLVDVRDLVKHYPGERAWLGLGRPRAAVRAVDGVSFAIPAGQTLGLVGESGSGKTTVARTLLRLTEPSSGSFQLDGIDVFSLAAAAAAPRCAAASRSCSRTRTARSIRA